FCPAVLVLTKSILSSNRAFALIQSSLRLRSACPEPVEGTGFLAFSARSGAFRNPEFGLLRWDQIKFAGRLFVEQRAFFLISAAPMLVPSGNTYEITRAHALLTGVVLVQIGALDHDKPDIVGVSVHSGVETGTNLVKLPWRPAPSSSPMGALQAPPATFGTP